jgi:hypothetical protein
MRSAATPGRMLVAEHDERGERSGGALLVVEGCVDLRWTARSRRSTASVRRGSGPAVTRSATAVENGTLLLAIGAPPTVRLRHDWEPAHFEQVPAR